MEFVAPEDCQCYECVGSEDEYKNGRLVTVNNMKHHTFGEPCETCGNPKSEYRDLGTKGTYVCWYCTKRTAKPEEV
jgi:hypothetical protein